MVSAYQRQIGEEQILGQILRNGHIESEVYSKYARGLGRADRHSLADEPKASRHVKPHGPLR